MEYIQCVNVSLVRSFPGSGEKRIIDHISAQFKAGQMSLISGDTGAGKSTLLHILAGLIRPTEGDVVADSKSVSRWISFHRDIWRRKIGIIFQQPHLLTGLTVFENVCLPLIPRNIPIKTLREKGLKALECLGISPMASEMVMTLSGGERQRVAAARAIVSDPEVILADEPTAHQDDENVNRLMDIFEHFKRKNTLIIVVSHDPRIAEAYCFDTSYRIENGRMEKVR